MSTASFSHLLPDPGEIRTRIEATEEELKSLRRLLRLRVTAARADEARRRRTQHQPITGEEVRRD
jgi:hypothetical protein